MTTFQQILETREYSNHLHSFQNLMKYRVRNILLVCSLYDSFILEEDGQLYERLYSEHQSLNLVTVPKLIRVSSGREALSMLRDSDRIDLVITTLNPGDMIWSGTPKGISHIYPGDQLRLEVGGLGTLENEVVSSL